MEVFDLNEGEWLIYVECLEMFFVVNNVFEDKKVFSLIVMMGGKLYILMKSLIMLIKLMELLFKEIMEIIEWYWFNIKLIVIVERYKFYRCY